MGPVFQAHPVPQNVTNFEFHLVGDMTLKQFGYLGAGLGFAFLVFVTMATEFPFVAYPIVLISAAVGAAFAFLPIQERPLDHWMAAFFKAIFRPTKLVFTSKIINRDDPFFAKRLPAYLFAHRPAPAFVPASGNGVGGGFPRKPSMVDKLKASQTPLPEEPLPPTLQASPSSTDRTANPSSFNLKAEAPPSPAPRNSTPLPSLEEATKAAVINIEEEKKKDEPPKSDDLKKTVELAKEAQTTQAKIQKIEQQLSQIKQISAKPGIDPRFYVEQFETLITELTELNKKASEAARELAILSKGSEALKPKPVIEAKPAQQLNIPVVNLTTFPNVINGVVTDSQGNYIEGAIIVAHDSKNLPVRALKSNKLGQFVAATPLPEGTYTITAEKDSLNFDTVAIELNGEILKPVMIAAKKAAIG